MIEDIIYEGRLWQFIFDKRTNKDIALGICQYDKKTR